MQPTLCLDCATLDCAAASHRHVAHPELLALTIAHVDCDAFYASVEKSRRPELAHRPVLIGGGRRGVVTTACYIARQYGVRSAMPMYRALALCPQAVVIAPDFAKYSAVAAELRVMLAALTPVVQPLSIDEAVLDLAGTQAVHGAPPAVMLARFAQAVPARLGITVSIGLARNRLLAKVAAGWAKPRGFSVMGAEAAATLAPCPVGLLPGVGPVQSRRLAGLGITRLGQLQTLGAAAALRLLGPDGPALAARARGEDARLVGSDRASRSISADTTFDRDLSDRAELEHQLWRVTERLTRRLAEQELCAGGIVLKLKTAAFATSSRGVRLPNPSRLPDRLFAAAARLLARQADGTAFRLIGIAASPLLDAALADPPDLADPDLARMVARQAAVDRLRARFGPAVIGQGRGLPMNKP